MDISPKITDLVDIEEALKWQNYLIAAKAFSNLAKRIITKEFVDPKESEAKHLKLFFDCFYAFGSAPLDLIIDALPILLQKQALTKEVVLEEFTIRLKKIDRIQRVFYLIVDTCELTYSQFLTLASQIDNKVLQKVCLEASFQSNHIKYVKPLVFSGLMTDEQKRQLGNSKSLQKVFLHHYPDLYPIGQQSIHDPENYLKDCSESELRNHQLADLDTFETLRVLMTRPGLRQNPNLKSHIIYLPFLCFMPHYVSALTGYHEITDSQKDRRLCNALSMDCRGNIDLPPLNFVKDQLTIEGMLSYYIEHDKVLQFIRFAENYKDSLTMFRKPEMLAFLATLVALAPQPSYQKRLCALVNHFVRQVPEQADTFFLWALGLFGSTVVEIEKKVTLDTMVEMAVNRFVVDSILRTFIFVSHQTYWLRDGFDCLAILLKRHTSIIPILATHLNFNVQDDDEDVFRAKVNVAKECCKATEDNKEVLELINRLFRRSGFRLVSAIDILRELLDCEVLELKNVRRQVERNNLAAPGKEKALASYCAVLGYGSVRDENEPEEVYEAMKKSCLTELYHLTMHYRPEVVSKAWKAVGEFETVDIEAIFNIPGSSFGAQIAKVAEEHLDGFIDFLRQQIHKEVETFSRALYNIGAETLELPPLLSKVDSYKDQMFNKNKDEPWFWSATLPLTGSILQLAAPSNKVLTATRLLKSCLMSVPLSTSHEDLLRLMAGWRICVRETLNVLSESKSNDILWARDQICQEGKVALTHKTESVDNIMMMLTALADVIDEKLKVVEDQNHLADVVRAQKPWIISVFEFIATRLPKEVKQKRDQKEKPIYQVLTHSNKSSLHIAIFCTRLLFRNANITEFYGDESILGLAEDRMLVSLLKDSSQELDVEEIPNRKMLWIAAEAYGADEMTVNAFESIYQSTIDNKSKIDEEPPSLETNEDVEKFFSALVLSAKNSMFDIQQRNKKVLERIWNNGTEDVKRKIYEGLAELARVSGTGRKRKTVTIEKLPESSVLRGVLQMFDEKHNLETAVLQKLTLSLVNHKRKDGRFLPPIDWMKILKRCDWAGSTLESRLAIVTLACEQNLPEVLFAVSGNLTEKEIVLFAEHLPSIAKLLPTKQFKEVLNQMTVVARLEKDLKLTAIISEAIAAQQKNPTVREYLTQKLSPLYSTNGVTDCILKALKEPEAFKGVISANFDVWLEARRGDKMNMKVICDIICKEQTKDKKEAMLGLLSLETRVLSISKRLDKILDVITASRIARSQNEDLISFLPIVMALVVSISDKVDIPICFFDSEKHVVPLMICARREFWMPFLELKELESHVEQLGSFFRPYIHGPEKYDPWQKMVARDLLLSLVARFPTQTLPNLYAEPDAFWDSLVPVQL